MFINSSVRTGFFGELAYVWLLVPESLLVGVYSWMERVRKEAPKSIVEFLRRLGLYI